MGADGAFHDVGVHLDTAVVKEDDKAGPVPYRVAHRPRQIGGGGHATDMMVQPVMQGLDDRPTSFLALLSSVFG
jgi:hypothetical protein